MMQHDTTREPDPCVGRVRRSVPVRPKRVQQTIDDAMQSGDWSRVYRQAIDEDYGLLVDEAAAFREWLQKRKVDRD